MNSILGKVKHKLLNWFEICLIKSNIFIWHNSIKVKQIRKKEKIRIAFTMLRVATWSSNELFYYFERDKRYWPYIVILPHIITYSGRRMIADQLIKKEMSECASFCEEKGIHYISAWDSEKSNWRSVGSFRADIVIHQNSYEPTTTKYKAHRWWRSLQVYYPYFVTLNNKDEGNYGLNFFGYLWKYYLETEYHKQKALEHLVNKKIEIKVTGHPKLFSNKGVLKRKKRNKKKLIYAPHHSISGFGSDAFSTFEAHHNYFLGLSTKYCDEISFIFKPHPQLYEKLCLHPLYGKFYADSFYEAWIKQNSYLICGDYFEVFQESDGLIHDCTSFLLEYLTTGKPSLFLRAQLENESRFNKLGLDALSVSYIADSTVEIENFISRVILGCDDDLKAKREKLAELTLPNRDPSLIMYENISTTFK